MNPKPLPKCEEPPQRLLEELDIVKGVFFIQVTYFLDLLEKHGFPKKDFLCLAIQAARLRDFIELEIELANRAREAGHR